MDEQKPPEEHRAPTFPDNQDWDSMGRILAQQRRIVTDSPDHELVGKAAGIIWQTHHMSGLVVFPTPEVDETVAMHQNHVRQLEESVRILDGRLQSDSPPVGDPAQSVLDVKVNLEAELDWTQTLALWTGAAPAGSANAQALQKRQLRSPFTFLPIVLKPTGGMLFRLIGSVEVKPREAIEIDANSLVSYITVRPLTLEGFPELEEVFLAAASERWESSRKKLQRSETFGTAMLIKPGRYDVGCHPGEGNSFTLVKDVEIKTGQGIIVDANRNAAAFVCRDPAIPGLKLEKIWVMKAGTSLQGMIPILQEADAFGIPMMVSAGDLYDIALKQSDGVSIKIEENVSATAGRITYVCGKDN